eukprot:712156_1
MEDSHSVYLSIPNHPTYSLFAVFDGFNGNNASSYLSYRLINVLNNLPKLNDDCIIIDAINKMDKDFLKLQDVNSAGSTIVFALIRPINYNENVKIKLENVYSKSFSGISVDSYSVPSLSDCTFSCSTSSGGSEFKYMPSSKQLQKYDVSIFWVGDSRSTLITNKNNKHEQLTIDHHCNIPTEKKRIIQNNGTVIINNKINGITELSRSFGCYSMKNNKERKYNLQKHVCIAGVSHKICESNDTLLLYCDGLYEKWNTKQLISKYFHHYND